jgi:hypothetical protein
MVFVMNYGTLTPDLSALARAALSDEPFDTQEVPNFETTFETEHKAADEEYALWITQHLYN